jgi:hypothetical protein
MRENKREFVTSLTDDGKRVIQSRLELTPEDFWVACRHGERRGVNSIGRYVTRLQEKTKGYAFDFGEPT